MSGIPQNKWLAIEKRKQIVGIQKGFNRTPLPAASDNFIKGVER